MTDQRTYRGDTRDEATTMPCRRCRSPLVVRRNRYDGSEFYGCRRYPACTFTAPLTERNRAKPRIRPSHGGRVKDKFDVAEVLVARYIFRRQLRPWEGLLVQLAALALLLVALTVFFTSGAFTTVAMWVGEQLASSLFGSFIPSPSPT